MRISTSQLYDAHLSRIRQTQSNFFEAQKQVTSGMRFEKLSEDPVAGQRVLSARGLKNRIEKLDSNLRNAREYVGLSEDSLGQVSDLVKRAYVLALQGSTDTADQAAKDALAAEVEDIQKRLVDLGNTQTSTGGFLFAGQQLKTKPFIVSGSTVNFVGDDLPINVETRPGELTRVNVVGAGTAFKDAYDKLETLKVHLRSGNSNLIGDTDIAAMQSLQKSIDLMRGNTGIQLQKITNQEIQNERRMDDLQKQISEAQEVDLSDAVTKMRLAETAYNAALQVAGSSSRLSLLDFVR